MLKERVKLIVLVLLIISSVFFTSKIWQSERLWPNGYNLFINPQNWPVISTFFKTDSYSMPLENLSRARKIVASDGQGSRAVFYNSDRKFDTLYGDIRSFFEEYLSGSLTIAQNSTLRQEDLRNLLNDDIIFAYVNYSIAYTPQMFGQVMSVNNTSELKGLSAVRDFFIMPNYTEQEEAGYSKDMIELLAIDYNTGAVMRYSIKYPNASELILKLINSAKNVDVAHNCNFALEGNMDIKDDVMQANVPLLAPFVVLDTASTADVKTSSIISKNPLIGDAASLNKENVVRSFNCSPQSIHRYTTRDGTVVYLENDATLKLHKSGLIEYTALDANRGIRLIGTEEDDSPYESLNAAIKFTEKIWNYALPGKELNVCVSSNLLDTDGQSFVFYFDYYYEGTPVFVSVESTSFDKVNHAVEIKMQNGVLTQFRLYLRDFEKQETNKENITIYQAIDEVAKKVEGEILIDDIFLCYPDNGSGEEQDASWAVKIKGENFIIER